MKKRLAIVIAIAIVMLIAYLLFWPVPIAPIAWTPSPNPGMTGAFAQTTGFRSPQKLIVDGGLGPEDVTRGADGFFYTGLQDGRILRFRAESRWRHPAQPARHDRRVRQYHQRQPIRRPLASGQYYDEVRRAY